MKKIRYFIDNIELENEELIVSGWSYADGEPNVEVTVVGVPEYKIEVVDRLDICEKFDNQKEALHSGFKITMPQTKKKFSIVFKIANEEIVYKTSYKKFERHRSRRFGRIRTIIHLFNPYNIIKVIKHIQYYGFSETFYKIKGKLRMSALSPGISYDGWYRDNCPKEQELLEQRSHKFDYEPKISIVVPTYNTKESFLVDMIESVINQTYSNWELCIADGASSKEETIKTLREYEGKYENIKVKYLEENYMISGNTNEALELATGEYIGLFDHDDLLTPNALYEVVSALNKDRSIDFVYSDEDKTDEKESEYFDPNFKPDWSPDTLTSYNYITHFTVFSKELLDKVGNFNSEYDGSQDYDLFLRLTEKAEKIHHISKILYHWRVHKNSTASGIGAKTYCMDAAKGALKAHLNRIGEEGTVKDGKYLGSYKVEYKIKGNPKVSIVIPNKDEVPTLKKCLNSIFRKTTYENYEIIIVENNSTDSKTFEYYKQISKRDNVRVLTWKDEFNYSAINNFGVKEADGEYIILLNNDVEIISRKWIEEMLMHAQRKQVGIVGAKLYYPDETVQHAGVILGIGSVAGHSHKYFHRDEMGFVGRLKITQNLSAVTAACLMVRKDVFNEVNGLDEEFKVAFNDVDFCMKVREKGYLVIFTPYVELYHYESKSRGAEDSPEKIKRFNGEIARFESKWGLWLRDPYYNENLTLLREDFSLREKNEVNK